MERKSAVLIVAIFVVGAATIGAIAFHFGGTAKDSDNNSQTVARAWNRSISALGIAPIYPPEEDVNIGDIYAIIVNTDEEAFQGRSIRLAHVDLTEEIRKNYEGLVVLPDAADLESGSKATRIQVPKVAAPDLFKNGKRTSVPIVAFPGFTLTNVSQGDAGGLLSRIGTIFGLSRTTTYTDSIELPDAGAFGISPLAAYYYLNKYCKAPSTGAVCADETARTMLSMVIGSEIRRHLLDAEGKDTGKYALRVEIAMVYRVFLTRSIIEVREVTDSQVATARLALKLDAILEDPSLNESQPAAATPSVGAKNTDAEKNGKLAEGAGVDPRAEQRRRIQSIIDDLSSQSSGFGLGLNLASAGSNRIALSRSFVRPVVIGVRTVRLPTIVKIGAAK